ncbi:Glu/Leu/Phe/Val dehydrogenase [Nanoarchaeota archaeon]
MVEYNEIGPEKIIQVYDPETGMRGITVIDNTVLGPAKGGIRMIPDVSVEEVSRLARAMTYKNALADLPFGGGKSGIIANSKEISPEQKDKIVAAFSRKIKEECPNNYIAAPDMYMAEHEMEVFVKANGDIKSATGKPQTLCQGYACGIPHELGSTGYGVYHSTLVAMEHKGIGVSGSKIAIEGFGNVGTFAAQYLSKDGAKIIAVSDSKGAIYNENGLDVKKLLQVKLEKGSVVEYDDCEKIPHGKIFELDVDVLIPAAKANVINEGNVSSIKAKIIVQGANIPSTVEIENKLHTMGVLIIPDFIANAGGVISSYVEHIGGKPEEVFPMIERKIRPNTKLALERAEQKSITPRDAGIEIAKERILNAKRFGQ